MDALATVLEMFGGSLRPSYALLKAGDDRSRLLWDKHKIQVIEYADYGNPLVELIRSIVSEVASRRDGSGSDSDEVSLGPAAIPETYLRWLRRECDDTTPFGMEPRQGQSVSLQQVYVPPVTSRRLGNKDSRSPSDETREGGPETSEVDSLDPTQRNPRELPSSKPQILLGLLGEQSLYVSGDPGTGKSTFCRWVALASATGTLPA